MAIITSLQLKPISTNKANCKEFLQFIERYLSNGKCDEQHNKVTSLKNCLLRTPGSINSDGMAQVKILEKWDGKSKLDLSPLYQKFQHDNYRRLAKKVVIPHNTIFSQNSRLARQVNLLEQFCQQKTRNNGKHDNDFIPWIERLLKTPIPDHRKYCMWRILAPYLINVKHLSFKEAFDIIDKWLYKCNDLKPLDFDTETKVNDCLKGAVDIGYLPISLNNPEKEPKTLKTDNRELYNVLVVKNKKE